MEMKRVRQSNLPVTADALVLALVIDLQEAVVELLKKQNEIDLKLSLLLEAKT